MDAPSLQTLPSHWPCHSAKEGQIGCKSDKDYVWCRLFDKPQACCQHTQPMHSACTMTTRQESAKVIGCLQAETRQQEASIRKYLQPFRCTETQFRRCRMTKKFRDSLKRNTENTRFTSVIPAQYLVRLPIQTYVRVQTRLRDMQDSWLSIKADEIQSFADRNVMKKFFDAKDSIWSLELRNHPTP